MPTKNYNDLLFEQLRDPEVAAEYLSAAIENESSDEFLLALRNVAEAHGGTERKKLLKTSHSQNFRKIRATRDPSFW